LNNSHFNIQSLFEEPDTVQMLKVDEKKGIIQNCFTTLSNITESRKIDLQVGGVTLPSILDTGRILLF